MHRVASFLLQSFLLVYSLARSTSDLIPIMPSVRTLRDFFPPNRNIVVSSVFMTACTLTSCVMKVPDNIIAWNNLKGSRLLRKAKDRVERRSIVVSHCNHPHL